MRDEEPLVTAASPAETLIADAAGVGDFLREHEINADGGRAASKLGQWSWALFEAARDPNIHFQIYIISPFFVSVMMRDEVRGQELWGATSTWAGIINAVFAPFMGAVADKGGPRKPWIAVFALMMVLSFAGTWFGVPHSTNAQIFFVAAMVVLNNVMFEFSNFFHGAMLSGIAPTSRMGGLSGLSYALGNGSGVILLVFFLVAFMLPGHVHAWFIPDHPLFGVDQAAHEPERLSGPITALWMFFLAIPLFLWTPDRAHRGLPFTRVVSQGVGAVFRTVLSLKHYKNIAHYIGARTLFNDGMTGVLTFIGIYASGTFHMGTLEMVAFGVEVTVFAALGGLFGGWIDNRFGSRNALFISIGGTTLFFALGLTMAPDRLFWFWHTHATLPIPLANTWPRLSYLVLSNLTAICIVAGYANSRTMMARIAPAEKMTEFFGLMSLSGAAATFLAPIAVTWATWWTQSQRGGMVAVAAFLFAGLIWMFKVKEERATIA
jgi:MFS transporter, UMF1 family